MTKPDYDPQNDPRYDVVVSFNGQNNYWISEIMDSYDTNVWSENIYVGSGYRSYQEAWTAGLDKIQEIRDDEIEED